MLVLKNSSEGFMEIEERAYETSAINPYCACSFSSPASCVFYPGLDINQACSKQYVQCSFSSSPNSICGTHSAGRPCAAETLEEMEQNAKSI